MTSGEIVHPFPSSVGPLGDRRKWIGGVGGSVVAKPKYTLSCSRSADAFASPVPFALCNDAFGMFEATWSTLVEIDGRDLLRMSTTREFHE